MEFAHKASAFNNWCENAEEDLSEPVHCVSLDAIQRLKKDHEDFLASLARAQGDFNYLLELDQQIKALNVSSSPYTWLTVEVLERIWNHLSDIVKVAWGKAESSFGYSKHDHLIYYPSLGTFEKERNTINNYIGTAVMYWDNLRKNLEICSQQA